MLTRLGYRVMTAGTPSMAIQIAETHIGEIHLLMTDVVMPEMNGRNLAAHLLARYPLLKRLFMSGYTAEIIAHHGVLEEGVFFIQKPFSMKDLAAKVREVVEYGKAHEAPPE
jgi:response regulator RpfG family c-di-GMP phosphodiesterase